MPRGRPRGAGSGPNRIKGAMSAYACFVKTCREEHHKLHPDEDVKFGEFSAQCSQRWKTMTDKEKQRFHEMAMEDKERYEFQMKDYVPPPGMPHHFTGRRRRRRVRRERDPNKPKRALSAFFFFAKDIRPGIKEINPDFSVGEIAKELGRRWSEMTDEAKAPYEKQSEDDKARYDRDMKVYRSGGMQFAPQMTDSSNGHPMMMQQPLMGGHGVEEDDYEDEEPMHA